jgi:nucleoside phosphorylase
VAIRHGKGKKLGKRGGSSSRPLVDFAFITAIEIERAAVCDAFKLKPRHRVRIGARVYWRGQAATQGGDHYEIVVAQSPEMAQVEAAILTNDTIHDWDPAALLLVGVAGAASDGTKEDDEALGDLILGRDVYYYDRGKVTPDGTKPEPIIYRADATLWNNVITLPPMRSRIPVPRPDGKQTRPAILQGVIASGEKVIAEAAVRDEIASGHRKTLAIEMEGYGFSAAVWQSAEKRHHLVMKAICDRADRDKKQNWQPYAAAVAAQYAKHFLKDRPLEPRNKQPQKNEDSDKVEGVLKKQDELEQKYQHTQEQLTQMQAIIDQLAFQQTTEDIQTRTTSFGAGPGDLSVQPISSQKRDLQVSSTGVNSSINDLLTSLSAAVSALSQEKAKEIERIRELNREGKVKDALQLVRAMRSNPSWKLIEEKVQAKALRVEAGMALSVEHDSTEAQRLADEAKRIDPLGDDTIIRTLLRFYEEDAEQALKELGEPASTDGFNLKVTLLIYANRFNEALELALTPPEGIKANADTRRWVALALLMTGDVSGARSEIQDVLREHPQWESVRALAAVIDYFSCLSPAAAPKGFVPWPQPIDLSLTKVDAESQDRLKEAEVQFAQLIANTQRGDEERKVHEAWRLACIANAPERQKEAEEYCQTLLREDPTNHRALLWAVVRDFDVDLETSEKALSLLLEAGDDTEEPIRLEKVIALVAVRLKLRKTLESASLLAQTKKHFVSGGIASSWTFWNGQTFIIHGEPEKAIEEAEREPDLATRRRVKLMALREMGYRTGDWQPLVDHLERSFEETKDGIDLLELFRLKFFLKDWSYVVERGRTLINLLGTADAVRFAVAAAWKAQQPKRCLALLDENVNVFPEKNLPSDLRRLRSRCQVRAGMLGQAVKSAEALVADDPTTENVINLLDVQRQTGDLKGLAFTARTLLERNDVEPRSLVRAARLVLLEHKELAQELWHRAKPGVMDDPNLVMEALLLGYALGYDASDPEVTPLFERMQEFTAEGRGPGEFLHKDQLRAWIQETARRRDEIAQNYYKGTIPSHLFAAEHQLQLSELLHRIPEENRRSPNPRLQPSIFIRHGGRFINEGLAKDSASWRLHLDVTSLLVAVDLEILEEIEKCFAPLRISTLLQTALIRQRENLRLVQPVWGAIFKAVVTLLDNNSLRQITNDIEIAETHTDLIDKLGQRRLSILLKAQNEGGFVIDRLPLKTQDFEQTSIELPDELGEHVLDPKAVVDSLRTCGALSEVEYNRAIESLNIKKTDSDAQSRSLPNGTKLFLLDDTASSLAKAGVLGLTCSAFDVYVDSDYVKTVRSGLDGIERRAETEAWIARLSEHIRAGLINGLYEGVDVSGRSSEVSDDDEDDPAENNWDFATGSHLLRYECQKGDVLCFDDRSINSFVHRDYKASIVGINEVLLALRLQGKLTEQQYYDKLIRLRASNYRYIPFSKEEILYHLNHTSTAEGKVVETYELAVLRRYLAACLLDAGYLQKPPLPKESPNPTGELKFISDATRAITEAMVGVWANEAISVEDASARSRWILHNLYTGIFGTIHLLPNPEGRGDGVEHIGLDICSAFVYGQTIHGNTLELEGYERRRQFFEWLDYTIVRRRQAADPNAISLAARGIATTFCDTFDQYKELKDHDLIGGIIKYQFYVDLPTSLRDAMKLKPELMEWLGFELTDVIYIGDVEFDASAFWRAAGDAIARGTASARARKVYPDDADAIYTFRTITTDDKQILIEVSDPSGEVVYHYGDRTLELLKGGKTEREAVLRNYRFWFDLDLDIFETEVKEIASFDDPQARLERINDLRKGSASYFYWSLRDQIVATKEIPESGLMPPDAESLLRHFRLPTTFDEPLDVPSALSASASSLVENYDIQTALTRLACLPVKMPQTAVEIFSKLEAEEKKVLLTRFKDSWQSPVGRLHFVDLVLRSSAENFAALESAKSVLSDLFSDEIGGKSFAALELILNYVNIEFSSLSGAGEMPARVRLLLMWGHACHLYDLLVSIVRSPDNLMRLFRRVSWRTETDTLFREPDYWNDCLHPRRINRTVFLAHAVASLLGANDQQVLEKIGVKETLDNFLSADEEHEKLLSLLQDPKLATNGAGSFFGGDRAEVLATVLEVTEVQGVASSSVKEIVRQAIEDLKKNPADGQSWVLIKTVISDLPLYPDLRESFQTIARGLNISALIATDPGTATYAVMVTASQLPYYPDAAIKSHLELGWLELVKHYSTELSRDDDIEEKGVAVVAMLLEGALGLATELNDARATSRAWGGLLMQMLNIAPDLSRFMGYLILKRVFELPAAQLHGIFPVLLAIRALNREPL